MDPDLTDKTTNPTPLYGWCIQCDARAAVHSGLCTACLGSRGDSDDDDDESADTHPCCECGIPSEAFQYHEGHGPLCAGCYQDNVSASRVERAEEAPMTTSETTKPGESTMSIKDIITRSVNNMKMGAEIGAAGEATILCVEMAEAILGKQLPVPDALSSNPALVGLAREIAGVAILRTTAVALGKKQAATMYRIADLAEMDIGVRAVHAIGPLVRDRLGEFMDRADGLLSKEE